MKNLMKISEIAEFFGVSPKAMRLYEQKGIIKPCKVDAVNDYRYYSPDQVKQRKIEAIENIENRIARKQGKEITEMTEDERAQFIFEVVSVEELKASRVLSEAIWL